MNRIEPPQPFPRLKAQSQLSRINCGWTKAVPSDRIKKIDFGGSDAQERARRDA